MFLEEIKTKEYYDQFIRNLNQFLLELFGTTTEELEKSLHERYDYKFASILQSELTKNGLDLSEANKLRVDKLLREMLEKAKDIDILEMHIAFEPTERFLGTLKSWIYKNIESDMLLDIKVDKKVIGGATLVHKGNYFDLSIGTKLDQYNSKKVEHGSTNI